MRSPRQARYLGIALSLSAVLLGAAGVFAQAAPEARRFAILVGIDQYADPGLVPLQKAQNDAEDLGKALSRLGGYKTVTVMSGGLPFNDLDFPSKNKIVERIQALAEIVRPEDQVLFFFSGHGVNDKSGASYLLPIDALVKDPTGTGIDLQRDISAPLEASGLKNLVFLIDACQKTVAKDKGLAVVGVNEVKAGSRAVVITATGKGKAGYEDPRGANGIFTRSILTALGGEGDLDRDGYVSVGELERYLPDAVSEYAFSVGMTQKPAVFDSGAGLLQPALARVGPAAQAGQSGAGIQGAAPAPVSAAPTAKAQFVQFKLPEGLRVDLRLLDSDGREVKAWSDTPSLSEKVEPGSYRVEAQDRNYLYYPFSATFTVGSAKTAVVLDLKPNFGSLSLTCDPADGVDVILNGEKRGTLNGSALTIDRLKSGSYELVLNRDLYDSQRRTIRIEDGKPTLLKLSLSPDFFTLALSEKSGMAARLYVDGQDRGALPLKAMLPFRDASLRVVPTDPRYKEWSDTVRPSAKGGVETRVAALVGRVGTIEVTTDPDADAALSLVPAAGGASLKIGAAPLDYEALVGDYSLLAEASVGGRRLAAKASVTVREGQVFNLRLQLKDGFPAVKMIAVPAGTFSMGSPGSEAGRAVDEVQHQVSLSAFAIGAFDVTVGDFRAFAAATGYKTSAELDGGSWMWNGKEWAKTEGVLWDAGKPGAVQTDSNPVVNVSWYDAVAYCNWRSVAEGRKPAYRCKGESDFLKWAPGWNLKTHNDISCDFSVSGYRLPTEAEWEYAAKGGSAASGLAPTAVYAGSADMDAVAWYTSNSGQFTHPVGQKRPNALGLYDMSGNVLQWCQDWYDGYPAGAQTNPRGPGSGENRILRGGSWCATPATMRSSYRLNYWPYYRAVNYGFRLARLPVE